MPRKRKKEKCLLRVYLGVPVCSSHKSAEFEAPVNTTPPLKAAPTQHTERHRTPHPRHNTILSTTYSDMDWQRVYNSNRECGSLGILKTRSRSTYQRLTQTAGGVSQSRSCFFLVFFFFIRVKLTVTSKSSAYTTYSTTLLPSIASHSRFCFSILFNFHHTLAAGSELPTAPTPSSPPPFFGDIIRPAKCGHRNFSYPCQIRVSQVTLYSILFLRPPSPPPVGQVSLVH